MANVVGMLEIQMAADLARLSKDMSSAQATVTRTVSNINNILGDHRSRLVGRHVCIDDQGRC